MLFVVLTYRSIPAPLSKMNYPEGLGPDRKSTSATRGPTKIKFTLNSILEACFTTAKYKRGAKLEPIAIIRYKRKATSFGTSFRQSSSQSEILSGAAVLVVLSLHTRQAGLEWLLQ